MNTPRHPLFPQSFIWGSATSSHQVEGINQANDWWRWEQSRPLHLRSGRSADQWHRWESDLDLLKELGQNGYRLSIEWSRIEPEEGRFDAAALEHYRLLLLGCRERGITTIVTLHHFTNPCWFSDRGGWKKASNVSFFLRYAERCVAAFGDAIDLLVTINEPQVYAFMSYQIGAWPPNERTSVGAFLVTWNMAQAHRKLYTRIKTIRPELPIGVAYNMTHFSAADDRLLTKWVAKALAFFGNRSFYWLSRYRTHDFFGINYYFHRRVALGRYGMPTFLDPLTLSVPVSDLGWELYPEGLRHIVRALQSFHRPLLITEHGLADRDDSRRPEYLTATLSLLEEERQRGLPIIGYLHWSLLDNFEWADGYDPRFGLIAVDYTTQARTPRPSALLYKAHIVRMSPNKNNPA